MYKKKNLHCPNQTGPRVLHRPLRSSRHILAYRISWGYTSSWQIQKNNRNRWHACVQTIKMTSCSWSWHAASFPKHIWKKCALILIHEVSHSKLLHVHLHVWQDNGENSCIQFHLLTASDVLKLHFATFKMMITYLLKTAQIQAFWKTYPALKGRCTPIQNEMHNL